MSVQYEVNDNVLGYDASHVEENKELNFMGAKNFKLPALLRLYTVWASGIIGEPQYYRDGDLNKPKTLKHVDTNFLMFQENASKTSTDVFMESLRDALDVDYQATLCFASTLRNEYLMRLGPQVIMVEAGLHHDRAKFNEEHPKLFREVARNVILIPTDLKSQMEYYVKKTGGSKKIPSILKMCWRDALERFSQYQYSKYAGSSKMVDIVRLSHPRSSKNECIAELVETGQVKTQSEDTTWEKLKSNGSNWKTILSILGKSFPHMALLRNLRGISQEMTVQEMAPIIDQLVRGVKNGKQFPFRYYTAYQQFDPNYVPQNSATPSYRRKTQPKVSSHKMPQPSDEPWKWKLWREHKKMSKKRVVEVVEAVDEISKVVVPVETSMRELIQNGLERCMKEAIKNLSQLEGRVVCLSDNSGSAHGAFTSEYGSQSVAVIGNLSSIITCMGATEGGEIGIFGDRLHMYKVSKERGIIEQLNEVNAIGKGIGQGTENGIWLWFKEQYEHKNNNKNVVDHLFIYSDMQAGHGGLYGLNHNDYKGFQYNGTNYIDVIKLIERHRMRINDKINIFTIQTAGYDNSLIPETMNRTAVMAGWTSNELNYACAMVNIWNNM